MKTKKYLSKRLFSNAILLSVLGAFFLTGCTGEPTAVEADQDAATAEPATFVRVMPATVNSTTTNVADVWRSFDNDTETRGAGGDVSLHVALRSSRSLTAVRLLGDGMVTLIRVDGSQETELFSGELEGRWKSIPLSLEETSEVDFKVQTQALLLPEIELWGKGATDDELTIENVRLLAAATHELADDGTNLDVRAAARDRIAVVHDDGAFGVLSAQDGGSRCASFSITLDQPSSVFQQAFLAFKSHGAFRPFELSRSINAEGFRTGTAIDIERDEAWLVERVDPSKFKVGENKIQYCIAANAREQVLIEKLQFVGEFEDGATSNAVAANVRGDTPQGVIALNEAASPHGLFLPMHEESGVDAAELTFRCALAGGDAKDLDVAKRHDDSGQLWLEFEDAASPCDVITVSGTGYEAAIGREATILSSKLTREPELTIASPSEHFGQVAWVEGWAADKAGRVTVAPTVRIDGETVDSTNGVFGVLLTREETSAEWAVEVTATFADGEQMSKLLRLTGTAEVASNGAQVSLGGTLSSAARTKLNQATQFGTEGGLVSEFVSRDNGGKVWLGAKVGLDIPAGAVRAGAPTAIGVKHLPVATIPPLDPGMVNVTGPDRHAYEMLPHGQQFSKKISVTLPFDPALLPAGKTEKDVRTYFYDTEEKHWTVLERTEVSAKTNTVASVTDHFTTMINATLVGPEQPGVTNFNPTQMSGIEAAHPGAGIQLIGAPSGNSMGDANLSYPIEVVPGRGGMQPSLAVSYSSAAGNGAMGVGWGMNIPAIVVDTRWGVPRYDDQFESESYLLNGEQLLPFAHRGPAVERNRTVPPGEREPIRTFTPRVEGAFAKIERRGMTPANYWWTVTDKMGRTLHFGRSDVTSSDKLQSAVLTTDVASNTGDIFYWPLRAITDPLGNYVEYQYDRVLSGNGHDLYLRTIRYTGHVNSADQGRWRVGFLYESDLSGTQREDAVISARGGFQRVTADLLRRIHVYDGTNPTTWVDGASSSRSYEFTYTKGPFGKTLLQAIGQHGAGRFGSTAVPFTHEFTYFDETGSDAEGRSMTGFVTTPFETRTTENDMVDLSMPPGSPLAGLSGDLAALTGENALENEATLMSGSQTAGTGTTFSVGWSPVALDGASIGFSAGGGITTTTTLVKLMDVNGDGMPDRVYQRGAEFFYKPNISNDGTLAFDERAIPMVFSTGPEGTLPALSRELSTSLDLNVSGSYQFGQVSQSLSAAMTAETSYFSDVNADGMPDLVHNGGVLFGRIVDGTGRIEYFADSGGTLAPLNGTIEPAPVNASTLSAMFAHVLTDFSMAQVSQSLDASVTPPPVESMIHVEGDEVHFGDLVDTVKRFRVPYAGVLEVSGNVTLDTSECESPDGVRVAIQHNGGEFWHGDVNSEGTLVVPTRRLTVSKDDSVYFRVGSVANGACDAVHWNPRIEYIEREWQDEPGANGFDANGRSLFVYDSAFDFTPAGHGSATTPIPFDGSGDLSIRLDKTAVTTDDLVFEVEYIDFSGGGSSQTWTFPVQHDDVAVFGGASIPLSVSAGGTFSAHIYSQSNIDLNVLDIDVSFEYSNANAVSGEGLNTTAIAPIDVIWDADFYSLTKAQEPPSAWTAPASSVDLLVNLAMGPNLNLFDFQSWFEGQSATILVKQNGALVRKQNIVFLNFAGVSDFRLPNVAIAQGDPVFVEVVFEDQGAMGRVGRQQMGVMTGVSTFAQATWRDANAVMRTAQIPFEMYAPERPSSDPSYVRGPLEDVFPNGYRGWSVAGYVANGAASVDPIDESQLVQLFTPEGAATFTGVYPYTPVFVDGEPVWRGPNRRLFVGAGRAGASRTANGLDFSHILGRLGPGLVPPRIGLSVQGGTTGSFFAGAALSGGVSASVFEFMDLNGDRYPDIVGPFATWMTGPTGARLGLPELEGPLRAIRTNINGTGAVSVGAGTKVPLPKVSGNGAGRTDSTASSSVPLGGGGQSNSGGDGFALSFSGSVGATGGLSETLFDHVDINGDGLPDRVAIGPSLASLGAIFEAISDEGAAFAGENIDNADGVAALWKRFGVDEQNLALTTIYAALNQGYSYGPFEPWEPITNASEAGIGRGVNTGANANAGGNVPVGLVEIGASLSVSVRASGSNVSLVDVNGDGLVDVVSPQNPLLNPQTAPTTMLVRFNNGQAFGPTVAWGGLINALDIQAPVPAGPNRAEVAQDRSLSGSMSVRISGKSPIQIGPAYLGAAIVGESKHYNIGTGRQEVTLRDINGDGFPDHLVSSDSDDLRVALNPTGRTNLLHGVARPMGATVTLDYDRTGNTLNQPHSRFVLSDVRVFDGLLDDWKNAARPDIIGADFTRTSYSYEGGHYDRLERAFLGFSKVTATEYNTNGVSEANLGVDGAGGPTPYRRRTQFFDGLGAPASSNGGISDSRCDLTAQDMRLVGCGRSVYGKGLVTREVLEDVQLSANKIYSEALYTYAFRDEATGNAGDVGSIEARLFPMLVSKETRAYEGGPEFVSSATTYEYDSLGNVVRVAESGDVGTADDVRATIDYSVCPTSNVVGAPTRITVFDASDVVVRMRNADIDCGTGLVSRHRTWLESGLNAKTDLSYDGFGNIASVSGPIGADGQRYEVFLGYVDPALGFVTSVTDSFGYTSLTSYDERFGLPAVATDINGQKSETSYDEFGRMIAVRGPNSFIPSSPYYEVDAIEITYSPNSSVPFASTKNADVDSGAGEAIEVFTLADGLGRVLQVKKDATVTNAGGTSTDMMVVSGRVAHDFASRTIASYFPTTEALNFSHGVFQGGFDAEPPTRSRFDVLNRSVLTTFPDGTESSAAFSLENDLGKRRAFTRVVDANQNTHVSVSDVRGLMLMQQEFLSGVPVTTRYSYDELGQLGSVTDDKGNLTRLEYDMGGRRISVDNPDTGAVTYTFDAASNLTKKVTPNLRAAQQSIDYTYDRNRLMRISYPQNPQNDVEYTYGSPSAAGAPHYSAGRITTVSDASGIQLRRYGPLGEVVEEIRSINHATGNETYSTRYRFDPFGRLRTLTYPDGEVLTYDYDSGGKPKGAAGAKDGVRYTYVAELGYDKFGQRTRMTTGTGITTTYAYDPKMLRLETLKSTGTQAGTFQDLRYSYDNVGNVTSMETLGGPSAGLGGRQTHTFGYDTLYRLTSASGTFRDADRGSHAYSLAMSYDSIHNITLKDQAATYQEYRGSVRGVPATTYKNNYKYRTSRPHAPSDIGNRAYTYDANGNQLGYSTRGAYPERTMTWDEENRLQQVVDRPSSRSSMTSNYVYDSTGERTLKYDDRGSETAYVNQHYQVQDKQTPTKHVYVGTSRVASKVVPSDDSGTRLCTREREPREGDNLYFYHSDHLGSAAHVTNCQGRAHRHTAYFPFGETWVDQGREVGDSSYLFTGKELDAQTGLYYFGARYYDPRTSVWQSTDPILYEEPERLVRASRFVGAYAYAFAHPVNLVDPDGRSPEQAARAGLALSSPAALEAQEAGDTYTAKMTAVIAVEIFTPDDWDVATYLTFGSVDGFLPYGDMAAVVIIGGRKIWNIRKIYRAIDGIEAGASFVKLPMGFKSLKSFADFGATLRGGMKKAGFGDVRALMQGSAVTGKSFRTGVPFDVGRKSDFDVALTGSSIMEKAKAAGIKLRGKGTRTGPLNKDDVAALGLTEIQNELSKQAGRKVEFMLFESVDAAARKAPSVVIP